ncbi:VCBS domain-containing protein [Bifidobacterium sp. SO1]|uniref:VCBS domain-containing protein n=1 Tax=Bifidobacterium sp. SO1 TaxID=2809029 RepID=UPI001BDDA829|nr:VCBS domain-containing protein [Bifidobacterium sp. SO1]MBT1161197.1 VCBS domain-containing protein [Bifidobacterium sp. SO1]
MIITNKATDTRAATQRPTYVSDSKTGGTMTVTKTGDGHYTYQYKGTDFAVVQTGKLTAGDVIVLAFTVDSADETATTGIEAGTPLAHGERNGVRWIAGKCITNDYPFGLRLNKTQTVTLRYIAIYSPDDWTAVSALLPDLPWFDGDTMPLGGLNA